MRKPLKYKGYINLLRRSVLLLKEKKLDFAEYGFYIFLLQEVDWYRPRSTYGHIPKTDLDLAFDCGCSPSTISRKKERLQKLGLIEITSEGLTKIVNFEKYSPKIAIRLAKLEVANLQEDIEQTQSVIADSQREFAEMQQSRQESDASFSYFPHKDTRVSNDEEVNPDDIPF